MEVCKEWSWIVGLRIVSSMDSTGIHLTACVSKTLEVQLPRTRKVTVMDKAVLAPADQGERACGLREGLAGALPKVKCKLWVNDLIPIIPMWTFCNTSLVCVEKREGIVCGCSKLAVTGYRFSTRWKEVQLFKETSTLCKLDQSQLICPTMVRMVVSFLEYW